MSARLKLMALLAGAGLAAIAAALSPAAAAERPAGLDKIDHIIVIYLENRSFDNLFAHFPRARGLARARNAAPQLDPSGQPYSRLPQPIDTTLKPPAADPRFPADLRNAPFPIDKYVPIDQKTGDLVHRFYQEQQQIDGGKMDKFVLYSDAAGLVMGHYDARRTKLWGYARRYVLADNFFHAAFGGSFLNHFWLVCACTPHYPNAPAALVAKLDKHGLLAKDGAVTPDGEAVNTIQSAYQPHSPSIKDQSLLLPPQEGIVTIGDQLSAQGVSWAWYSGGFDDAVAGHPDPLFQFHHQPLAYLKQFADGTAAKKEHLKDEKDFLAAIEAGKLPAVVFWKPLGAENEHPGYADIVSGDRKVADVLTKLRKSPLWKGSAVIITYDENGGFWDHVAPPKLDKWGPGARVPTIIVSPFAKRAYVDHTLYDTTSILKFIQLRYRLAPLGDRESRVGDLTNAFRF